MSKIFNDRLYNDVIYLIDDMDHKDAIDYNDIKNIIKEHNVKSIEIIKNIYGKNLLYHIIRGLSIYNYDEICDEDLINDIKILVNIDKDHYKYDKYFYKLLLDNFNRNIILRSYYNISSSCPYKPRNIYDLDNYYDLHDESECDTSIDDVIEIIRIDYKYLTGIKKQILGILLDSNLTYGTSIKNNYEYSDNLYDDIITLKNNPITNYTDIINLMDMYNIEDITQIEDIYGPTLLYNIIKNIQYMENVNINRFLDNINILICNNKEFYRTDKYFHNILIDSYDNTEINIENIIHNKRTDISARSYSYDYGYPYNDSTGIHICCLDNSLIDQIKKYIDKTVNLKKKILDLLFD